MFKTILVANDGSAHARHAVDVAAQLAAIHGARVIGVHVLGSGDVPPALRRMVETEHLVAEERLSVSQVANLSAGLSVASRGETHAHLARVHAAIGERIAAETVSACREAGVQKATCTIADGDPVRVILDRAAQEQADLIVMGTRGLSGLEGLMMGSVSQRVCQRAACPCLTVK